jgi:lantibiotic biosynthesis protein
VKKRIYSPVGPALVRLPLLPFEFASRTSQMTERGSQLMNAAIAVGSPSLFASMQKNPESPRVKLKADRYRRRMCTRPTPYGLFAGVALAEFGDSTDLCRGQSVQTNTRPDMCWLSPLIKRIEADRTAHKTIHFLPNAEILMRANRIWLEHPNSSVKEEREAVNARATQPVLRALALAQDGLPFAEIVLQVSAEFGVDLQKARKLCDQLCDLEMLVSELRVPLFDVNPFEYLLAHLGSVEGEAALFRQLKHVCSAVANWDALGEKSAGDYTKVLDTISATAVPGVDQFLQIDMKIPLQGSQISHLVAEELAVAAELCLQLSPSQAGSPHLVSYKESFLKRYQHGREVQLLELISETFGLGSPYLGVPSQAKIEQDTERDQLLVTLGAKALKNNTMAIDLTEAQLETLTRWHPDLTEAPATLDIFASVSASSRSEIDRGNFQVILAPHRAAIGAGRAMGRFAAMLGCEAVTSLKQIAAFEQRASDDAIVVDISFWTDFVRAANIAIAPRLREHSIVARCAASQVGINIPLKEVVVGIRDGRFYARWIRTGQKILARSNSMLNLAHMPTSIRFLADIARDGMPEPAHPFDWGPAEDLPFLPRVNVGKVTLRHAQWSLRELSEKCLSSTTRTDFANAVEQWRQEWNVPRHVQAVQTAFDESPILLDLMNKEDLEELQLMLAKKKSAPALLQEYIHCEQWHANNDGHHVTEIVASFVRSDLLAPTKLHSVACAHNKPSHNKPSAASDFLRPPGSDWLYLKLTCNRTLHEQVIASAAKVAHELKDSLSIEDWFFVRYADPFDHLRLRFHVTEEDLYSQTMPQLCRWAAGLISSGRCAEFSFQTYDREIERYGGVGATSLAEELFSADSDAVAALLSLPELPALDRKVIAVLSINNLLSVFGMDALTQGNWLTSGIAVEARKSAAEPYRELKSLLYALLSDAGSLPAGPLLASPSPYASVKKILVQANDKIRPIVARLRQLDRREPLSQSVDGLCQSFVHMHCNRLLGINRDAETLSRMLLANALNSQIKRSK